MIIVALEKVMHYFNTWNRLVESWSLVGEKLNKTGLLLLHYLTKMGLVINDITEIWGQIWTETIELYNQKASVSIKMTLNGQLAWDPPLWYWWFCWGKEVLGPCLTHRAIVSLQLPHRALITLQPPNPKGLIFLWRRNLRKLACLCKAE